MNSTVLYGRHSVLVFALVATSTAAVAKTPSDAQLIASAERAAPAAVARDATVLAMDTHGKMRALRKG
ncbi:MAG: hypothetical protein ACREPP_09200, partial [Rhodanobacteraceae bacterium]